MSLESLSEVDKKFFADNLLLSEDWQDSVTNKFDDFSGILDLDSHFNSEDFIPELPDNLAIPMLEDSCGDAVMAEPWKDPGDSSDSGLSSIEYGPVKVEPLSPVSSNFSDGSFDSFQNSTNTIDGFTNFSLDQEIKLESPPQTPPHDLVDIISTSSIPNGVSTTLTENNGLVQITKVVPMTTQPIVSDGVTQVLNSKVKIQPKPISPVQTTAQTKSTIPTSNTSKPLVLTPEEFAKLTAKGVLKFQPPGQDVKPAVNTAKTVAPPKTSVTPVPPAVMQVNTLPDTIVDSKAWKRQQRMIKNRESACLSRKRKKEYLNNVEEKLKEFNSENEKLRQENALLRQKVEHLQSENERLKMTFPYNSTAKKVTCVLGVLFLISLNLGPMSSILMNSNDPILSSSKNIPLGSRVVHHGRSLLSVNDDTLNDTGPNADPQKNLDNLQATVKQFQKTMQFLQGARQMEDWHQLKELPDLESYFTMCPPYFNSTESQRLMQDLTGWVLAHKTGEKQPQEDKQMDEIRKMLKQRRKRYNPPRKVKAAMKGTFMPEYSSDRSRYEMQIFKGDGSYVDFLNTIHRRNDTFYVVSFRNDHFLLPATAHNKTMRPRMSLVMPAPHAALNESTQPPAGSVAMMQIDCEVMDTRLIHVHKSAVPDSQRDNFNASSESFQPMQQKNSQENKTADSLKFRNKRKPSHKVKGRL